MHSKLIGGIMLIVGTSIGAGMLALPVATGTLGFLPSIALLFLCWFTMMMGALLILEAALWLPANSHLISMAGITLGKTGQAFTWIIYLLLLYVLLSAYIAGGAEITQYWMSYLNLPINKWGSAILFTLIMGYIVYRGIFWIDVANRWMLSSKLLLCVLLILFLLPLVSSHNLSQKNVYYFFSATSVIITSFGFSTIVPSLCDYFDRNVPKIRMAIIVGSFIPLLFYVAWSLIIHGVLDKQNLTGLQESNNAVVQLSEYLTSKTESVWIQASINSFTSICVLTSFLGVALCLSDFLADGCKIPKVQYPLRIALITFLPPLLLVIFIPSLFIKALSFAGIYCIILLVFLPALMVYQGRYVKKIAGHYQVKGGKFLLFMMLCFSVGAIALTIFDIVS